MKLALDVRPMLIKILLLPLKSLSLTHKAKGVSPLSSQLAVVRLHCPSPLPSLSGWLAPAYDVVVQRLWLCYQELV